MAANKTPDVSPAAPRRDFLILLVCLLGVMGVLFAQSFRPEMVCFDNDGPLGARMASQAKVPEGFSGMWGNLNWLGVEGVAPASLTSIAQWVLGPLGYAKFWIPLACVFLGLSAWIFCRALKFSPWACVLGGLIAALHSDPFSNACWGQVSRPMSFASMFLALAALQAGAGWQAWVRVMLAGMAVGLGIMEGFDVGALFSLVAGLYVLFQALVNREGHPAGRLVWGGARLAVVVIFSAFLAAQALSGLIGTQVKGVAGMSENTENKQQRWDWATLYSVPKMEILTTFFPGIFGYRINTPEGGQYWGTAGRDPGWNTYFESGKQGNPPPGNPRAVGAVGNYAGQLTLVLAVLALAQSFRRKDSVYSPAERKFIWFWGALAVIAPLLMFGRYAPFYKFFYMLPYASTIRNPGKFGHLFDAALIVLTLYGAHGLCRRLAATPGAPVRGLANQWQWWRKNSPAFERRWLLGSFFTAAAAVIGWMIYASSATALKKYLIYIEFDPVSAADIAQFSIRQAGWFALFLTLSLGAVALVMSGYFSGQRAKFGAALLGTILVLDLGRAHQPWIVHWDWEQKYASNPVLDKLRSHAYEQRVVGLPQWIPGAFQITEQARGMEQYLDQLYRIEWAQHHFLYYDIQSLDVIQMPRPPEDMVAFDGALRVRSGDTLWRQSRQWELTNTRYIIAMAGFVDLFNKQFDPGRERFRVADTFAIVPKPGVARVSKLEELTAEFSTNAPYALIEFTGALPRAKLYANWQVVTNDQAALDTLASPAFNPAQTVLIAAGPAAPAKISTNQDAGSVTIKSYSPRRIELNAVAAAPAVLLFNERLAPNWRVTVDGKPETLLRCNYLMRGVHLAPGTHAVEFRYAPPTTFLKISLVAMAVGALLLALLWWTAHKPAPAAGK